MDGNHTIVEIGDPITTTLPEQVMKSAETKPGIIDRDLSATMPFTSRHAGGICGMAGSQVAAPKLKKYLTTKMKERRDSSNDRSQENKGSRDNLRNRNDLWIEEQKANFEMTYLKP